MTDTKFELLWAEKGRIYWKKDKKYLKFEKEILYDTNFSFDEVFDFCPLTQILNISEEQKNIMKIKWWKLANSWDNDSFKKDKIKLPYFAAVVFLVISLPFDEISNIGVISTFEMEQINNMHYFNYRTDLKYDGDISIKNRGPLLPAAFMEWLDDDFHTEYNQAVWWFNYCMYERINGLEPFQGFIPTRKL